MVIALASSIRSLATHEGVIPGAMILSTNFTVTSL